MGKNKSELYESKNYQKLIKLNGFIKIPLHLSVWHDISPTECMIYAYIDNATKHLKNKAFTDTETTLQCLCNSSRHAIRASLKNLINKGLIEKSKEENENGKEITVYRSLLAIQLKINIEC